MFAQNALNKSVPEAVGKIKSRQSNNGCTARLQRSARNRRFNHAGGAIQQNQCRRDDDRRVVLHDAER
jgi:hypothetical protein